MSGLDRNDTTHAEWDELAIGWALRSLEPDDEDRFSAHLRGCERCGASVRDSGRVLNALMDQLPLQSPSPELRSRLLAEASRTRRQRAAAPARLPEQARPDGELIDFTAARHRSVARASRKTQGSRSKWTALSTLVAAAAAVLVIAGLGIWNFNLQTDRDNATTVAAERGQILQDLAEAGEVSMTPLHDGDGQSVATLVIASSQAMIMTDGLPVNDTGDEIYVLWGLRKAGEPPQALGTFDVVDDDLDMRTVGSTVAGLDTFDGYALTLEPGRRAPQTPTQPTVASGQTS